jgi:putative transposase
MPRRARRFRPDSVFHIGCRGVDRQPIFLTDHDRSFFRNAMLEALDGSDAKEAAHCLMPNHFHWALATGEGTFDRMVHGVMTRHAARFNRLYSRTGHLFEGRHWSFLCEGLDRIENAIAYIHLNPVRAGIVRAPADWRWSSFSRWEAEVYTHAKRVLLDRAKREKISLAAIARVLGCDPGLLYVLKQRHP